MSFNAVNAASSAAQTYGDYTDTTAKTPVSEGAAKPDTTPVENAGATFEKSPEVKSDTLKQTYKPNTALVNQLKADADARTEQLRSLVAQLITGQGDALSKTDDIWSFLASGNYTVTEAAKVQAQKDIAEDGYWGVEQTSARILDFAKALSGGDPSKIEDMRKAFQDGFSQATDVWGQKLPDISSKTYDATMKKFDDWAKEAGSPNQPADPTQSET